jgi:hypothetical protein
VQRWETFRPGAFCPKQFRPVLDKPTEGILQFGGRNCFNGFSGTNSFGSDLVESQSHDMLDICLFFHHQPKVGTWITLSDIFVFGLRLANEFEFRGGILNALRERSC